MSQGKTRHWNPLVLLINAQSHAHMRSTSGTPSTTAHLDSRVQLRRALEELDERAMHAADLVLAHKALDAVQAARYVAWHDMVHLHAMQCKRLWAHMCALRTFTSKSSWSNTPGISLVRARYAGHPVQHSCKLQTWACSCLPSLVNTSHVKQPSRDVYWVKG